MESIGIFFIGLNSLDIYRKTVRGLRQNIKAKPLLLAVALGAVDGRETLEICPNIGIIIVFLKSAKDNENWVLLTSLRSVFEGPIILVSDLAKVRKIGLRALGEGGQNYDCTVKGLPRLLEEILGLIG
jgi:hypothetical protein